MHTRAPESKETRDTYRRLFEDPLKVYQYSLLQVIEYHYHFQTLGIIQPLAYSLLRNLTDDGHAPSRETCFIVERNEPLLRDMEIMGVFWYHYRRRRSRPQDMESDLRRITSLIATHIDHNEDALFSIKDPTIREPYRTQHIILYSTKAALDVFKKVTARDLALFEAFYEAGPLPYHTHTPQPDMADPREVELLLAFYRHYTPAIVTHPSAR